LVPITERDLAGAEEEAHTVAEEMRERLKDEDERAIRALELDGLTRRQLLQRLTKLVAEMDRLANEDDPTAGTLAEWAPATRAMFGKLTKSEIVGAVLEHEQLVEPAGAYRRRLLQELALRLAVNPRGGPVFRDRGDLEQLSPTERDVVIKGAALALARWWKRPAGEAERCRQVARISDPPWF
jgi:hypothetical protein